MGNSKGELVCEIHRESLSFPRSIYSQNGPINKDVIGDPASTASITAELEVEAIRPMTSTMTLNREGIRGRFHLLPASIQTLTRLWTISESSLTLNDF